MKPKNEHTTQLIEAYQMIRKLRSLITKAELQRLTKEDEREIYKLDVQREKLKTYILHDCNASIA
jgi:hypothetical protein